MRRGRKNSLHHARSQQRRLYTERLHALDQPNAAGCGANCRKRHVKDARALKTAIINSRLPEKSSRDSRFHLILSNQTRFVPSPLASGLASMSLSGGHADFCSVGILPGSPHETCSRKVDSLFLRKKPRRLRQSTGLSPRAAFRIHLLQKSKNSDHPDGCSEFLVGEGGFEPPKSLTTDLQSAPFGHSGIPPYSLVR